VATLALVVAAGLLGPLLAAGRRPLVPVVVGELVAGVLLGRTGLHIIDPGSSPAFPVFYGLGFAMLMLSAGTNVDLGSSSLRAGAARGAMAVVAVGALALPVAFLISRLPGIGQFPLVWVLLAGSSAAVAFPTIEERHLEGPAVSFLIAWIAIADAITVALVSLPLVGPREVVPVLLGNAAIVGCGLALYVASRLVALRVDFTPVRQASYRRGWALELRLSVLLLLVLASISDGTGASTLVAGFVAGMILVRLHQSRRLEIQLTGMANGFFVPIFFVLLGAKLDLRALAGEPTAVGLALALAAGAVVVHVGAALIAAREQRVASGLAASAQLGLPAAAASLGLATHALSPAIAAALVAAGCLTLIPASIGSLLLSRAR
jgi:Kef-type K+ transport system membrane component KefB